MAGEGRRGLKATPARLRVQVVWSPALARGECYYLVEQTGLRGLHPLEFEQLPFNPYYGYAHHCAPPHLQPAYAQPSSAECGGSKRLAMTGPPSQQQQQQQQAFGGGQAVQHSYCQQPAYCNERAAHHAAVPAWQPAPGQQQDGGAQQQYWQPSPSQQQQQQQQYWQPTPSQQQEQQQQQYWQPQPLQPPLQQHHGEPPLQLQPVGQEDDDW